uniref:Secreted protein n=1 Tax=Ditylenchus dipsaci TaxID=166011 RepID=A0A915DPS2_9BILA
MGDCCFALLHIVFSSRFASAGLPSISVQLMFTRASADIWTGIQDGVWEEVQSAGTDTKMNSLLFKFSETEAVKNHN